MKKITVKKTKAYWLYIALGIVTLIFGVLLLPFWGSIWNECPWKSWGTDLVMLFMAIVIGLYLFMFLIKKINRYRGVVQVLTIIEFVLLALIALGLVFSQFNILSIPKQPSVILGLALYCRGVIEIFRAYYYHHSMKTIYPVWWLVVAILFVTFGVYLMIKPLVQLTLIVWLLAISVIVIGIFLIAYGVLANPKAKK